MLLYRIGHIVQGKESICKASVNAADMLRHWAMFDEEDQSKSLFDEKNLEKFFRKIDPEYNRPEKRLRLEETIRAPAEAGKSIKSAA